MSNNNIELGFDLDALLNTGKGGGRRRAKNEYLKEGHAFYRILPSFDPNDRRINFEYWMHWVVGDTGTKMKVQCTKGTEGYCPLCEASKAQEELAERTKSQGGEASRVKMLEQAAQNLRASRSIYFNAVNAAGEVVALELNATVVKLLTKKMEAAAGLGFDPTHPKTGVWFRFTKSGKGRDSFEVDFKKTAVQVDGETLEKNDRTPLTDDLISRMESSVTDLKSPENLYIQIFTSKELADFLRGTPLKNKFQKRTQTVPAAEVAGDAVGTSASVSTSTQASTGTTVAATQAAPPAASNAQSEVQRLRNLSKGQ